MPEKSITSSVPNIHQDANLSGPMYSAVTIMDGFSLFPAWTHHFYLDSDHDDQHADALSMAKKKIAE